MSPASSTDSRSPRDGPSALWNPRPAADDLHVATITQTTHVSRPRRRWRFGTIALAGLAALGLGVCGLFLKANDSKIDDLKAELARTFHPSDVFVPDGETEDPAVIGVSDLDSVTRYYLLPAAWSEERACDVLRTAIGLPFDEEVDGCSFSAETDLASYEYTLLDHDESGWSVVVGASERR